jgi:uncharacterized membrane protein
MMLGWVLGRHLLQLGRGDESRIPAEPIMLWCGIGALMVFAIVRGANDYGNMLLTRQGFSLVEWLHVSKYPPSLSYTALELGLMALMIYGLMRLEASKTEPFNPNNPIVVFGQTALFFYLLHFIVIGLIATATVGFRGGALNATYFAALAALVILYPICRIYRSYKTAHPGGWTQYI